MNYRNASYLAVWLLTVVALAACGLVPDPLAHDEQGNLRPDVTADEVERAGIPPDCDDLADILRVQDEVSRIPILGGDREAELIVMRGMALCIDAEGGPDDGDPLEAEDEDAAAQKDAGSSLGNVPPVSTETDNEEGVPDTDLIQDPTPEPAEE